MSARPNARHELLLTQAHQAGLLPATASWPEQVLRPWPVVLLSALGAWLAVIPVLAAVLMLLGSWAQSTPGLYFLGLPLLALGVLLLRGRERAVFVEQLGLPLMLLGCMALGLGWYRDLGDLRAACAGLVLTLALAALLDKPWLRKLLGAAALLQTALALPLLMPSLRQLPDGLHAWLTLQMLGALLLLAWAVQARWLGAGRRAPLSAWLEALSQGWCALLLLGLGIAAGPSLLVSGLMPGGASPSPGHAPGWPSSALVLSSLSALVGAGWWMRCWPGLRQVRALGLALVAALLAWLVPYLGTCVLLLVVLVCSGRLRLAVWAAMVLLWVLGSFYYQLEWRLADKALVLVASGALLMALGWSRALTPESAAPRLGFSSWRKLPVGWLLLALLLVLPGVNVTIWQREQLLRDGQLLYLELQPVDPRSLLQGDYMALNFVSLEASSALAASGADAQPRLFLRLDAQGRLASQRVAQIGQQPETGEWVLPLVRRHRRWVAVSDAWFFKEGEGERYSAARYGVFRLRRDGQALLVGLADAELKRLDR